MASQAVKQSQSLRPHGPSKNHYRVTGGKERVLVKSQSRLGLALSGSNVNHMKDVNSLLQSPLRSNDSTQKSQMASDKMIMVKARRSLAPYRDHIMLEPIRVGDNMSNLKMNQENLPESKHSVRESRSRNTTEPNERYHHLS